MSTLSRKRIRLKADQGTKTDDAMVDVYTGSSPHLWVGNDVQFEIGIFHDGSLVVDTSNIASITLEVKALTDRTGAPLMTKTLEAADIDDITAVQWAAKTHQNALITFTGSETNLVVGSDNTEDYWLIISIQTTDDPGHEVTLQHTILKVVEDGTGSQGAAPDFDENHYTKGEADARYVQKHADQAHWQFTNGTWYGYIVASGLWYPMFLELKDGVAVPAFGEGVVSP